MKKKLKNEKGFTLIEIIAVVVIIALLAGISIPLVSKYVNDGKDKYNNELKNEFMTIVKDYYTENPDKIPKGKGENDFFDVVWLPQLQSQNYLSEELKNADGDSCHNSVGYSIFEGEETKYYVCLRCGEKKYYDEDNKICNNIEDWKQCEKETQIADNITFEYYIGDYNNDPGATNEEYTGNSTSSDVSVVVNMPVKKDIFLQINNYQFAFEKLIEESKVLNSEGSEDSGDTSITTYKYVFKIDKLVKGNVRIIDRCLNSEEGGNVKIVNPGITITGANSYIIGEGSEYATISNMIEATQIDLNTLLYCYSSPSKGCRDDDFVKVSSEENDVTDEKRNVTYPAYTPGIYNLTVKGKGNNDDETEFVATKEISVKNEIKFDYNGGTWSGEGKAISSKYKSDANIAVDLSDIKVNKENHALLGWKIKGDSSSAIYDSEYNENRSVTLVAEWYEKDGNTLKIEFYCDSDSTVPTTSGEYGVGDKFVSCAERVGNTQSGWSITKGASETDWRTNAIIDQEWIKLYKDNEQPIKLYAVWTPKKVVVTFYCSSTNKLTQTFTYGKTGQKFSKTCTKTGYNQTGWSLSSGGSKKYETNSDVIDSWINKYSPSITIYPTWQAKTTTVLYDCDADGKKDSGEKKQVFTYGKTTEKLDSTACAKTGYVFETKGWHRGKIGDSAATDYKTSWTVSNTFKDTFAGKTVKLIPNFTPKQVKVTFYCSSDDKKTQTFTYDKSDQKFTKKCTKTGMTLKGWSTKKNGDKVYKVSANVSNNFINSKSPSITLYPVWHITGASTSTCTNDKVRPVCEIVTSCKSVSGGVRAKFKCKDASSKFTIYSVFAETGWQADRFNSLALIKSNMTAKGTGSAGSWYTRETEWSTSTTPGNPPVKGKQYTFYFGAVDACGNRVVYDNVTTACKY